MNTEPIFRYKIGDFVYIYGSLCMITRRLDKKEVLSFVGATPYDITAFPEWVSFGTYEFFRFKDGKRGIVRGDYIERTKRV